ncbi:MAG: hypothetical protein ACRCXQ_06180 [Vagococcus fluvialis]
MELLKKYKLYGIIEISIVCVSIIFLWAENQVFVLLKEFMTEGAKLDINLLEAIYYRPKHLAFIFIAYFIILATHLFLCLSLKTALTLKNENLSILSFTLLPAILFLILGGSNRFWTIFLVIAILALALVYSVQVVSKKQFEFEAGDVLVEKSDFVDENEARNFVNKYIVEHSARFTKLNFRLSYEIGEVGNNYFVEIFVEDN